MQTTHAGIALPIMTVDTYGQFAVKFSVTEEIASNAYGRLSNLDSFHLFDCGEDFVVFDANDYRGSVTGVAINPGEVAFHGQVRPEGDDNLDGTYTPTEISLNDRMEIAALARRLFTS